MKTVIIDYQAGNVQSVQFALQRLGVETILSADALVIASADKVIFPGVGEASSTMHYLQKLGLHQVIPALKQPVLGICLGMQLLCAASEEGETNCLGVIPQKVVKFAPKLSSTGYHYKVPHIGWNSLQLLGDSFLPKSLQDAYVYYVHSYYVPVCTHTIATTDYIQPFSAVLQKDNFYATQFHPEKSGNIGETILKQFLAISF